jgi:putative transposase
MSTYTQLLYQIVFSTKNRAPVMIKEQRDELYWYITGLLKNKNCHPYRINGIEDHLHIITHIHPSIAVSDLVKDIKLSGTDLIKTKKLFPGFAGWQDGFAAFSYSIGAKENLVNYVMNQEIHHQTITYIDELIGLLREHEIEFDERYLL